MPSKNTSLHAARKKKDDEYYTRGEDVRRELKRYSDSDLDHFRGKTVYCNCDDPTASEFYKYFDNKFKELGLKQLITTCYRNASSDFFSQGEHPTGKRIRLSKNGDVRRTEVELKGDGDFRSDECRFLLDEADIVVTNPPFSLFREYISQIIDAGKKFLVVGPMNAITYKEFFPLIKDNRVWEGYGFKGGAQYTLPNGELSNKHGNHTWWTNLDHKKRHKRLRLFRSYTKDKHLFRSYDNYNAINVDKLVNIPADYDGVMGVPISFISHYNPEQFEIVRFRKGNDDKDLSIDGVYTYFRILIQKKKEQ